MAFKIDGYASVLENRPIHLEDAKGCRLGKWYREGDGKRIFGTTPSYAELETPHATIHEAIRKSAECTRTGTCEERVDEIVANFEKAEEASSRLFILLDRIIEENDETSPEEKAS
ncbi:CZB domain-containing protein [Hydrogenimonas sp.]